MYHRQLTGEGEGSTDKWHMQMPWTQRQGTKHPGAIRPLQGVTWVQVTLLYYSHGCHRYGCGFKIQTQGHTATHNHGVMDFRQDTSLIIVHNFLILIFSYFFSFFLFK